MCSAGRTHVQSGHAGAVQTKFFVLGCILKKILKDNVRSSISIDFEWFRDSIFGRLGSIFEVFFPSPKQVTRVDLKWNPVEGICDTSQIRGELGGWGGHGEASGRLGWPWEAQGCHTPNIDTPLTPNAKVPFICKFYDVFVKVGVTKSAACAQLLLPGSINASGR